MPEFTIRDFNQGTTYKTIQEAHRAAIARIVDGDYDSPEDVYILKVVAVVRAKHTTEFINLEETDGSD